MSAADAYHADILRHVQPTFGQRPDCTRRQQIAKTEHGVGSLLLSGEELIDQFRYLFLAVLGFDSYHTNLVIEPQTVPQPGQEAGASETRRDGRLEWVAVEQEEPTPPGLSPRLGNA